MGSNSHGVCLGQEHREVVQKTEQRHVCGVLEVCSKNTEILLVAAICLRTQAGTPWAENVDGEGCVLQV